MMAYPGEKFQTPSWKMVSLRSKPGDEEGVPPSTLISIASVMATGKVMETATANRQEKEKEKESASASPLETDLLG